MKVSFKETLLLYVILPAAIIAAMLTLFNKIDYLVGGDLKAGYDAPAIIEGFDSGKTLKQTFICDSDNITAVDLLIATYDRPKLEGEWYLVVTDEETQKSYVAKNFKISSFKDNEAKKISIPKISGVKGKLLSLNIRSMTEPDMSATIYIDKKSNNSGELIVDGERIDGRIKFNIWQERTIFELLDRGTQLKPGFVKGGLFYILIFLFLYCTIVIFFYFISFLAETGHIGEIVNSVRHKISNAGARYRIALLLLAIFTAACAVDILLILFTGGVKINMFLFTFKSTKPSQPVAFMSASLLLILFILHQINVKNNK